MGEGVGHGDDRGHRVAGGLQAGPPHRRRWRTRTPPARDGSASTAWRRCGNIQSTASRSMSPSQAAVIAQLGEVKGVVDGVHGQQPAEDPVARPPRDPGPSSRMASTISHSTPRCLQGGGARLGQHVVSLAEGAGDEEGPGEGPGPSPGGPGQDGVQGVDDPLDLRRSVMSEWMGGQICRAHTSSATGSGAPRIRRIPARDGAGWRTPRRSDDTPKRLRSSAFKAARSMPGASRATYL